MADIFDSIASTQQNQSQEQQPSQESAQSQPQGSGDIFDTISPSGGIQNQAVQQSNVSQSQGQQGFPSTIDTPTQSFQGSPLTLVKRVWLSRLDDDQKMSELNKTYQYVSKLPDGRIAVGNDINNMQPISSDEFMNDALGHIADHVKDAVTAAAMTVGTAGLGGLAAGGAELAGGLGAASAAAGDVAGLANAAKLASLGNKISTAGRIVGAGLGAGATQAAIEPTIQDNNLKDAAGRIAIQAAFGGASQGLLEGIGAVGKDIVSPRLAKLWSKNMEPPEDGPVTAEYINQGQNPSKSVQFQQALFKLTSNVDPRDIHAIQTFGPEEVFSPTNTDPEASSKIADGLYTAVQAQQKKLGTDLSTAADNFGRATAKIQDPSFQVDPNAAYQKYLQGLEQNKLGTVVRDGQGNVVGFNFTSFPNMKQDVNLHKTFMTDLQKLGESTKPVSAPTAGTIKTGQGTLNREQLQEVISGLKTVPGFKDSDIASQLRIKQADLDNFLATEVKPTIGGNTFILPSKLRTLKVGEAVDLEKGYKGFTDDPNINHFFKNPAADGTSIYDEFSRIANKVNNPEAQAYLSARKASADFFMSQENLHAVGGPDLRYSAMRNRAGAVEEISKFLQKSTTIDPVKARALDDIQSKIPYNFVEPALKNSAALGIKGLSPNFFRFGMLMNFLTAPFGHTLSALNLTGGLATATPGGMEGILKATLKNNIGQASKLNPVMQKAGKVLLSNTVKRELINKLLQNRLRTNP